MAYSSEYRKEVLNFMKKHPNVSFRKVADIFSLAPQTVIVWSKTGGVNRLSTRRNNVKVDRDELRSYVEEHPDSYLVEIAEALGVKKSAIWYNLKAMGYSRKKKTSGIVDKTRIRYWSTKKN